MLSRIAIAFTGVTAIAPRNCYFFRGHARCGTASVESAFGTEAIVDAISAPIDRIDLGLWALPVVERVALHFHGAAHVALSGRRVGGAAALLAAASAVAASPPGDLVTSCIVVSADGIEVELALTADARLLRRPRTRALLDCITIALENALHLTARPSAVRAELRAQRDDGEVLDKPALWQDIIEGRATLLARGSERNRTVLVLDVPPMSRTVRRLSGRTVEVLCAAARGEPVKSIAARIGRCSTTVSRLLTDDTARLGVLVLDALRVATWLALPDRPRLPAARLTQAERDVLLLLREGLRNEQIAERRHRSPRTIANQVAALLHKTSASSRRGLALYDPV